MIALAAEHQGRSPGQPSPGIVIFEDSLQLCFINQRARELINQSATLSQFDGSPSDLPLQIIDLCARIRDQLNAGSEVQDRHRFTMQRAVRTAGASLRLRAFGVPISDSLRRFRIVTVIENTGPDSPDAGHVIGHQDRQLAGVT
jgi:hypothetical protein